MQQNHVPPRTDLERALFESRASLRGIAEKVGCSYEYVRLIAKGERKADSDCARKVLNELQTLKEAIQ